MRTKKISKNEVRKIVKQMLNEKEDWRDKKYFDGEFIVHGTYNDGDGNKYEIMLGGGGELAKIRQTKIVRIEGEIEADEDGSRQLFVTIDPGGLNIDAYDVESTDYEFDDLIRNWFDE